MGFSQRHSPDRQTAALIVSEAEPPATELGAKDPVFLPQILDRVLLLLVHPAGNRKEQKGDWIQFLRHRFSRLPSHTCAVAHARRFALAFNQLQFLDITGYL